MRDSTHCLSMTVLIGLFVRIITIFSESYAINITEKLLQRKRGIPNFQNYVECCLPAQEPAWFCCCVEE